MMKGQAALEFLMTYGWAILIVVVVVAALFTMNMFNPEAFVGESNAESCYRTVVSNDTSDNCNISCNCLVDCIDVNETMLVGLDYGSETN